MGYKESIIGASFPQYESEYLIEDVHEYPVSVNGKVRVKLPLSIDLSKEDIEKAAMENETVQKWLDGKAPKKVIVVPKKIVNIVL